MCFFIRSLNLSVLYLPFYYIGIYVSGQIIGVRRLKHHKKDRTYFGTIIIKAENFFLKFTTSSIKTSNGISLSWKKHSGLLHSKLRLSIGYKRNATIRYGYI